MNDNYSLLCAYKRNNDVLARNQLILENQNLIYYTLNHFFYSFRLDENTKKDMLSAGVLGLMAAIESFDIEHYETLSTYAVPYIRDRMSKVLSSDIPFSQFENEDSDATMEEQIEDNYIEDKPRKQTYDFLTKICSDDELEVMGVINRTCDEPYWSVNEIARELHMSSYEVRSLYKSGIDKLNQPWVQWYLLKVKGVCKQ